MISLGIILTHIVGNIKPGIFWGDPYEAIWGLWDAQYVP